MRSGKKYQKLNNNKMINLGVIGCGSVSEMYLDYLSCQKGVSLFACSDVNVELAKCVAGKYGISKVITVPQLLANKDIDIVLNLTNPLSHSLVNRAVLKSKKNLFCEKPYALNSKEADIVLGLAKKSRLSFYTAPDTYLSEAYKSAKIFIEKGGIGNVFSVNVISTCRPVESWHPSPEFFYKKGAGPLFDRGVYYLTALVFFFGKIISVGGYSEKYIPNRFYKRNKLTRKISVESQTHYSSIVKFKNGVTATLMFSFDVEPNPLKTDIMTIYGSLGVIDMPSPMEYSGVANVYDNSLKKWVSVNNKKKVGCLEGDIRGVAVIDMVNELKSCRLNYDNAIIANHVIKVMEAIEKSGKSNKIINIK